MTQWICAAKIKQQHSTEELRRFNLQCIEDVLRWNRLQLSMKIMNFAVDGPTSRRRPKLRWKHAVKNDLCKNV